MSSPVTPAQVAATVPTSTSSVCGNLISGIIKFPLLISQLVSWLLDSNGDLTNAVVQQVVKPGDLIFAATPASNTAFRLLCDGSLVRRADYPDLFAAIDTIYGDGDGSTTFQLPDFRDNFPVGAGKTHSLGQAGGEASHVLTKPEMPPHQHAPLNVYLQTANNNFATGGPILGNKTNGTSGPQQTENITGNAGGDPSNIDVATGFPKAAVAHNNLPPYLACFIYIKT